MIIYICIQIILQSFKVIDSKKYWNSVSKRNCSLIRKDRDPIQQRRK